MNTTCSTTASVNPFSETKVLEFPTRESRLWLLLAILLTAVAYSPTISFNFVHDDWVQLVRNPRLVSWDSLPRFFIEHTWKFVSPNAPGNYYRPLFMVWLWVNRAVFGLNPAWWHATTVILHLVVTFLVYRFSTRLTNSATLGAIAALLFGLHPAHIEAVAWIAGVTEPLMAAFVVGTVVCWLRWRQQSCSTAYFGAIALCALGMLAKETAFLTPLVLFSYEMCFGEERGLRTIYKLWPFAVVAAVYLVIRTLVLHGLSHNDTHPLSEVMLTLPSVVWFYIQHSFWPFELLLFYRLDWVHSVRDIRFWLPLCSVLATVALVFWARKSALLRFSALWFAVFLLPPILGLTTFVRGDLVHDRYLYLPTVVICLLGAVALSKLSMGREMLGLPAARMLVLLAVVCILGISTSGQQLQWRNDLTVFSRSVQNSPNNPLAKDLLANELYKRNRPEEAIQLYRESIQIDPHNWKTFFAAGVTCAETGHFAEADQYLSRAIAMEPADSNQFFYRGMTRMKLDRATEAEQDFRETLKRASAPGVHYWLGVSLEKQGKLIEAKNQFSDELRLGANPLAQEKLRALEGK